MTVKSKDKFDAKEMVCQPCIMLLIPGNVSEIASFACCLERPKYRLVKAILRLIRRNLLKLGSEEKWYLYSACYRSSGNRTEERAVVESVLYCLIALWLESLKFRF